jgi:hypothetical protein
MTALAADKNRLRAGALQPDSPNAVGLKNGQTVYQGSAVTVDASGYGYPASATASRKTTGVARAKAVGAGSDGAVKVEVDFGAFYFANKGGDLVVAGGDAYWEDDDTVRATGTGSSYAGKCLLVDATLGALVRLNAGT